MAIFAALLPSDVASATLAERGAALSWIIWIFTWLTLGVAVLVWFTVPEVDARPGTKLEQRLSWEGFRGVLGMKAVWLQAVIVICAYVGYKATDDFSLLARDAFGYDDVAAARVGTISFWVRPFAAVGAGFLGDRISPSRAITLSFAILMLGASAIAAGFMRPDMYWMLIATVAGTSVGIYALRGIYFALFQQAGVPLGLTGSAVGLVSVIGYTPDVFMGPVTGYLIDRSPGALGHQHVFAMVAGFALVGMVATLLFERVARAEPVD